MRQAPAACVAVLIAFGVSAIANAAPSGDTRLLEFKTACWGMNEATMTSKASENGWVSFNPSPNSYFDKQRVFATSEISKLKAKMAPGAYEAHDQIFSKKFRGREIYLWVASGLVRKGSEKIAMTTCSVLDPEADVPQ